MVISGEEWRTHILLEYAALPPPSSPMESSLCARLFWLADGELLYAENVMLLGEVVYKMGQKRRLALPKRFREELGDRVVLTRGYEGCLVVVGQAQWQQVMSDVEQGSFLDSSARESARFLFGGAAEVELDSQGRFIVPAVLLEHATLQDEVVFVGLGSWIEVWDKAIWQKQIERLAAHGAEIAQRLAISKNQGSGPRT